jgi:hypothetical protein
MYGLIFSILAHDFRFMKSGTLERERMCIYSSRTVFASLSISNIYDVENGDFEPRRHLFPGNRRHSGLPASLSAYP